MFQQRQDQVSVLIETRGPTHDRHHAVGLSQIEQCIDLIRAGGTTVCVGSPAFDQDVTIRNVVIFGATGKNLCGCLNGSANAPYDIARMARLWQNGSLLLEPMVTARRPLAEIKEAIADLRTGKGIRTALRIREPMSAQEPRA